MATNIDDIFPKVENEGATPQGKLGANEFNRIGQALMECQGAVHSISLNNSTPVAPDEYGNVNLTLALGDYEQVLTIKYDGNTLTGEDNTILSADGNVILQIQYSESEITQSGQDVSYTPTGQIVTLTVSGIDALGETTELFSRNLASVGHGSTVFTDIDMSPYLANGEQNIQFRITNTINANPKQQQLHIIKANLELRIEDDAAWYRDAKMVAGVENPSLTARYIVLGNVTKTLHVKFTGTDSSRTIDVTNITSNDPNTPIQVAFTETLATSIGFFGSNGVREVEAWVTCTAGEQTVESNHIVNHIIVVADASTATPMIAIQNKIVSMPNYGTETLFYWNMYNPSLGENETSDVLFTLGNQDKSTVFLESLIEEVSNNTMYEFSQNVSIDASGTSIDVYIFAEIDDTPVSSGSIAYFIVDNSQDYSAVPGNDFYLNPGLRSNSESNPARIINAATNTVIPDCVFQNMSWTDGVDGWIVVNGRRVFRIPAGGRVTIPYDVYSQYVNNSRHHLTIEIVFACRDLTNEDDPVITIGNRNASNPKGVYIKPLNGAFVAASQTIWDNADISWQENTRTHVAFNIQHNYTITNPDTTRGTNQPTTKSLSLIRTYINGIINKEYTFDPTEASEINAGGDIVLGQDGCVLDIYSIRVYKDTNDKQNLGPSDIIRNVTSALPTGTERAKFKAANDLLSGGLISFAKCRAAGLNCIVWHGLPVNKSNTNDTKRYGWAEIYIYKSDGTLDKDHSGVLYGIEMSGQGTTAMGYPEWNISFKEDKKNKGGDGIKYNDNGTLRNVFVDMNGIVCYGAADAKKKFVFQLEDGDPKAKKLVGKVNYASSMQNHKEGACNLYNDIYKNIVTGSVTSFSNGERVTVKEMPFLYFVQRTDGADDSLKVFQGPMTFGPGKADKPTWGVDDDDLMNGDSLIEGSLNNNPLTDARVPFVDTVENGRYVNEYQINDDDGNKMEAFIYAGAKNLNWGFGDTLELHDNDTSVVWDGVRTADKTNVDAPTTKQVKIWQPILNFLYLMNVGIKPWNDTPSALNEAATDADFDYKSAYWMTGSDPNGTYNRFDLYRCHYVKVGTSISRTFVPAGIRLVHGNGTTYNNFKALYAKSLSDSTRPQYFTSDDLWYDVDTNNARTLVLNIKDELEDFLGVTITTTGLTADAINLAFQKAIADAFAFYVDDNIYLNKSSNLLHHETMVLWAGTDNRSKNTYYRTNPKSSSVTIDGEVYYRPNMEMNDDDLDTILKTNNAGIQSKPYYIEMHDVDSEGRTYWDGQNNVLNNTLEATYGRALGISGTRQNELQAMMKSILDTMESLVEASDTMPDGTAIDHSPMGCMDKYFFFIQKYFPAVVYNETARIRYEVPATFYMSEQPAQAPLTQSLGDQYDSEREYMKRRLIMLHGYAGKEMDMLSFRGYLGNYSATIKPHYWLYPLSKIGNPTDTPVKSNVRVAAGQSFQLSIGTAVSGNTIFLHFINELSEIGNIGGWGNGQKDGDASTEISFTSERLKKFECYGATAADVTFPLGVADISGSTNIEKIDCHNCSTLTSFRNGVSSLMRLQEIDIRGTGITTLAMPQTTTLQIVRLPAGFTSIAIARCPNLATLTIGDFTGLASVVITGSTQVNTYEFLLGAYGYNSTLAQNVLNTVRLTNVDWTGVSRAFLNWLTQIQTLQLSGHIVMSQGVDNMPFAMKKRIIEKFGNIDSESNPLYIQYNPYTLTGVTVTGDAYFDAVGETKHYDLLPAEMNGNTFTGITWAITGGSTGIDPDDYAEVDALGNVTCKQFGVESGSTGPTVTLTATVALSGGGTLTASVDIRCYFRQARIGDFVYHDGSWDNRYNAAKSVIGICWYCKRIEEEDGSVWYDRRMVSLKNANSRVWGLYPNGASIGTNGFPSSGSDALTYDLNGVATSPFDVPNLTNFTSTTPSYANMAGLVDENDPSSDFAEDDPQRYFKRLSTSNNAAARLDPEELGSTLANGVYSQDTLINSDSIVPPGFKDTAAIIFHRDRVLNGSKYDNGTPSNPDDDYSFINFKPSDQSTDQLSTKILEIQNYAQNEMEQTYYAIYQQFLYPAASEAHAYKPAVAEGHTLDARFGAGHWYLPSAGEMARIFFLLRVCYSGGGTVYDANAYNLFKDIMAAAESVLPSSQVGRLGNSSYFWSSTEYSSTNAWYIDSSGYINGGYTKYNSFTVRPCAAF